MRSRFENFLIIFMLGILTTLTPFSIDMYLPSFPELAIFFSTSVQRVAFSVSSYFFGYAIGQILYGPLLDHFGRKKPVYIGLTIYILASLGCTEAKSLELFLALRFLQALGGSVGSVAAMAMVSDFFVVDQRAKVLSMMMLVLSASPLLAPSIGSFVIAFSSWRMIFWILSAIAVFNMLMIRFFLPSDYVRDAGSRLELSSIISVFKKILRDPYFFVYTLAGSFSFAGLFVFVAGSPAIFMGTFHVSSKIYSLIFATLASGMIGGGQFNILLMKKYKSQDIFRAVIWLQLLFSTIFLIGSYLEALNLIQTVSLLFTILLSAGISYPNAASLALRDFSKNAGSAAALLGFLQLGIGSVISACVGLGEAKGSLPTAAVTAASSAIAIGLLFLWRHRLTPREIA